MKFLSARRDPTASVKKSFRCEVMFRSDILTEHRHISALGWACFSLQIFSSFVILGKRTETCDKCRKHSFLIIKITPASISKQSLS